MRSLIRRMMREKWQIERSRFDLDAQGFGTAVYEIRFSDNIFSFVVFAKELDPERRSDRVIAEDWDMTATLRAGLVDDDCLVRLKENVPLQEKGRLDSECIVMTRANKSVRNFDYVVNNLVSGKQPSVDELAKVGYLYRTTAVYGSGKFGMADWKKLCVKYPAIARPFMAEMLACFMIRQFSLEQAEHIVTERASGLSVEMDGDLKRYIGIGNATGLGMAPYLINHPQLISHWMEIRETALARVLEFGPFDEAQFDRLHGLIKKAAQHLQEIATDNEEQNSLNNETRNEILELCQSLKQRFDRFSGWTDLAEFTAKETSSKTQELFNSLLLELFPELIDDLEDSLAIEEDYRIQPAMPLEQLKAAIEDSYDWVLDYDFQDSDARSIFWYRSEEKMEPRLGIRGKEPGDDREIMMGVAYMVQQCRQALDSFIAQNPDARTADFVLAHPEHRRIAGRIQAMSETHYGEVRSNLLDAEVLPINLLRCKLSFFGVGKFDPRSRLWVRNTMFQGAPLRSDIGKAFADDWYFPVRPDENPPL